MNKCFKLKQVKLDLSDLFITDSTIKNASKKLSQLSQVKTIKLSNNKLTENGFKYLLKSLKDTSVENLFVSNNKMGSNCLDYVLSYSKYNSKLKFLCLKGNNLDTENKRVQQKIQLIQKKGINLVF